MTDTRIVPLGLLQDLRDLANETVESRRPFAGHKHERQDRMDRVIRSADKLLAAAPQAEQAQSVAMMREALTRIASEDYEAPHDADNDYISQRKSACITRMRTIAREALLRLEGGV